MAALLLVGLTLWTPTARADLFERTWCELTTPGFRLLTDRPRSEAEAMAERLALFRPVAERYLPGVANARDPALRIVLFERGGDFRRATRGSGALGFMQASLAENLLVVGPDPLADSHQETLLHEYVHYLLRSRSGLHLPAWFDEGMASLLGAAEFDDDGIGIGRMPTDHFTATIDAANLSLTQVLEAEDLWRWRGQRRQAFYAWAWLLSHRLTLGQVAGWPDHREAMRGFLGGAGSNLPDALGTSAAALQRELERYARRRAVTEHHALPPAPPAATRYRCLTEPERSTALAVTLLPHRPELAVRRLQAQAVQHPDSVALWVALSQAAEAADDAELAISAARQAHTLDGADVDGAVQLASALAMGCILRVSDPCRDRWREGVPLLRRALAADPYRHDAVFLLGLAYLYSGQPGQALNYLRIAHGRQPWAAHVNFYLGESYRLIGDTRARAHLSRARDWSSVALWRHLAETALAGLDA